VSAAHFYDFVPESEHNTRIPCHHIPLNSKGETVHLLYRHGTQDALDDAVKNWLEATIERLKEEEKSS